MVQVPVRTAAGPADPGDCGLAELVEQDPDLRIFGDELLLQWMILDVASNGPISE